MSTQLILPNYSAILSHRRSTTFSLETYPRYSFSPQFAAFEKSSTRPYDSFVLLSEPSGPPQQVTLSDVTSTSVRITWGPVPTDDQNGIIRGYKVNYRALPNGHILTEFLNISSEEQNESGTKILKALDEFTNYSIIVLAFTIVGDGPPSDAKFVQTLEAGKLN